MLELPSDIYNIITLADWLELTALESGDRNASAGDLVSALQFLVNSPTVAEALSLDTLQEIELRSIAAGDAYPFRIESARVLQAQDNWTDWTAYIFCLCLSYFGWASNKDAPVNPWFLFEDLACIAAEQYIQGTAFKFGATAKGGGSAFEAAVNELCEKVKEGDGYKAPLAPSRRSTHRARPKDDKVDLVVWRDFPDARPSKLIMFGQCASGANWLDKISEMRPDEFWKLWMISGPVSPLIRSFYIPHRIPMDDWKHRATYAGVLFDRCRIAYWAWMNNRSVLADGRYLEWCKSVFPALTDLVPRVY